MDKKDIWLLDLYEGSGTSPNAEHGSAEEAASLRELKHWLDARSEIRSARPAPEAVEAVLAAARQASSSDARKDRSARRRSPARRRALRRMAGGALVAMLAMIALVGLFRLDALAPASTDTAVLDASAEGVVSETLSEAPLPTGEGAARPADIRRGEAAAVASPPETAPSPAALADAAPGADEALQSASAANEQAGGGAPSVPADIPAWDDPGDVMYLQQRIQRIGEGVADGWEAPVAPLEMLPAGSAGGGLVPASERR